MCRYQTPIEAVSTIGTGTGMCRYQTPIEAVSTMEVRELVCVGTRYL